MGIYVVNKIFCSFVLKLIFVMYGLFDMNNKI